MTCDAYVNMLYNLRWRNGNHLWHFTVIQHTHLIQYILKCEYSKMPDEKDLMKEWNSALITYCFAIID